MSDEILRRPDGGEPALLRRIWRAAFGSGDEDAFFKHMYGPDRCIVAAPHGEPVAAGYLLPAGDLIAYGESVPCAMIYAVATLPEHRGLGYGSSIVRKLISFGRDLGFPAIVICPSEESLFEYYSAHAGFRDWFFVSERRYVAAARAAREPSAARGLTAVRVAPDEYCRLREGFLEGVPHIKSSPDIFSYQNELCKEFGGGLFRFDTSGGIACAIIEVQQGGAVWIKELLSKGPAATGIGTRNNCEDGDIGAFIISETASMFPSGELVLRFPVWRREQCETTRGAGSGTINEINIQSNHGTPEFPLENGLIRRSGMLVAQDGLFVRSGMSHGQLHGQGNGMTAAPWFGPAFD